MGEIIRRPRLLSRMLWTGLCVALVAGCVSVKPVVLDRKTQLENQILGTFQRLRGELILASSVRGKGSRANKLSPLEREAVEAMMTREFNRDDVEDLKRAKVLGEGNNGLLARRGEPGDASKATWVKQLMEEENQARMVIMRRVIDHSPELSRSDLPEVRRIFYRLNVQTARKGDLVQGEDGQWSQKQ